MYTVKQVAAMAGVTVRTLHHYDTLGLLKPTRIGVNGYRYYDDAALLRLQQILLYRQMGLELSHIKDILDAPDFDLVSALRAHRRALQAQAAHLRQLIDTVDHTLHQLTGEPIMGKKAKKQPQDKKNLFKGLSEKKIEEYTREARLQYDPDLVNESVTRYNSYSKAQRQAIGEEGSAIYADIVQALEQGLPPGHPQVNAILARWHNHMRYFYEPPLEVLRGLADLYNTDPRFIANFQKLHPNLPAYLQSIIPPYVDALEQQASERLQQRSSGS
jgi:DNA-binding transcriptional MerR regulator